MCTKLQYSAATLLGDNMKLKLFGLVLVLGSQMVAASTMTCREAVVEIKSYLGKSVAEDDFASAHFEELDMTEAEFNALDPVQQEEIYTRITPLSVVMEDVRGTLNYYISRYSGVYEWLYADRLESLREQRDKLDNCVMVETRYR
jgi:hypothetical protein